MPQHSIRPDVVILLADAGLSRHGNAHQYHRDGTPFGAVDLELVSTATPEERDAAAGQMRLERDWREELPVLQKALDVMITKYIDQVPGDQYSISDICDVMTEDDRAECKRLVETINVRKLLQRRPERGSGRG